MIHMNLLDFWQAAVDNAQNIGAAFLTVVSFPLTPGNRLHVFYVGTCLLLAAGLYLKMKRSGQISVSLSEYLFPKKIWRSQSAWLDVRYFFFDQTLSILTYGSIFTGMAGLTFAMSNDWFQPRFGNVAVDTGLHPSLLGFLFALITVAVTDFVLFFVHYMQHKVPLLWEFHKVHHSAPVLHPLTAFRTHPVDKIIPAALRGFSVGILTTGTLALLGHVPSAPTLFGISAIALAHDLLGRNLRHSHIWLRWPGKLNYLFSAPAHHQLHHSSHPDHLDKNFAVMFPLWDLLFGTYVHPISNKDVQFGLGDQYKNEFKSCLDLYLVPFINLLPSRLNPSRRSGKPQN